MRKDHAAEAVSAFLSRGAAALLAGVLAACGTPSAPPSTIDISDNGVLIAGARASIGIPRSHGSPAEPQTGHAIELGGSAGSGSDTQTLSAGQQPVIFGGSTFSAPQQLAHDFDFRYFEVAYRFRWFFGDGSFGIEGLGGIAYARLDLSVSSPAQRASEAIDSTGASAGFGLIWRLRPGTSVQARGTFFASGDDEGVTQAQRFELSLMQAVGRNLGLRAGYLAWRVDSERENSTVSSIKLKFTGPALGLDLMF